jgi:multiple sugar transport system substrate-binding protein
MRKQTVIRFVLFTAILLLSLGVAKAQDKVQIRWYVGLGGGSDAPTIPGQQAVVDAFNASQNEIELVLEVVANAQAYDVLTTQIAAGNAPDIVGPMGVRGRASYPGAWLDLQPLIDSTGYDLTDFDPALVDFYHVEGSGQLGIPFGVYPYFMVYNKDLFDEAGIAYPPANYGDPYIDSEGVEHEWNLDTVRDIAMKLSVDANGVDATQDGFDPDNIVQWGFGVQMTDIRGRDTLFGAGNYVDADGNAVIPEQWRVAEQWYHDAMWTDYFYPNGNYAGSDLLGAGGNWFGSGNFAMSLIHTWWLGWGTDGLDAAWDMAPVPSYDGVVTAKLHADTFGIMAATQHPDEAFTVLTYMLGEGADALAQVYNAMPARLSLQGGFIERLQGNLQTAYPDTDFNLNWDVAIAALAYPDNPNHEEGMPSFLESSARYVEYGQLVDADPDADVNAELDTLQTDLQAIFDAATD